MSQFTRILNQFRATLPIVSLGSASAEESATIERIVKEVAQPLRLPVYIWDQYSGFQEARLDPGHGIEIRPAPIKWSGGSFVEVLEVIDSFGRETLESGASVDRGRAVFVVIDLHPFLVGERADYTLVRGIKSLAGSLKGTSKRLILMSQNPSLPDDLGGLVHEIENPLPGPHSLSEAIEVELGAVTETFADAGRELVIELSPEDRARLVRACQGFTETEATDVLRLAAVSHGRIDGDTVDFLAGRKIQKLRRLNVDFCEPPDVPVGGLDNLKDWLRARTRLFSAQASDNKLPPPRGVMLVGPPGTGKSLLAKTIGHMLGVPILSVDMGAVYSSLVGESEANLRRILATAEAISPCVLLLDEIEKALAGASGPSTDSGVSQRLFGKLLTWMADKKAPVFIVGTANSLDERIPPEFTRKGRFDEVFFVDLPKRHEREEILKIQLEKYSAVLAPKVLAGLSESTADFSGAELAAVVQEAAITAFNDDRPSEISGADLISAVEATTPLARRDQLKLAKLREWAKNIRPASSDLPAEPGKAGRNKAKMLLT